MGVLDPWHEQFEIRRHVGDRVKGCLHHGHPRFVIVSCSIVTRDKEYLVDLFPESFREPGILILRSTPVEDTGRNPAPCENRFPVYQHDNLLVKPWFMATMFHGISVSLAPVLSE